MRYSTKPASTGLPRMSLSGLIGETAIRRYFEGNRHAEIARQYILGEEIGAVVPDWGYSKELNQMLHDFRMGNRLKEDRTRLTQ
ncbi:MAG: hypothetical protein R3C11_01340 [Planctomycetaceae bacterium]